MELLKLAARNSPKTDPVTEYHASKKTKMGHRLAGQEMFLEMLHRERRRTERSGRAFLLILVSSTSCRAHHAEFPTPKVAIALSSCIREIDFLGWYKEPNTLGILITEFGETSPHVIESIVGRISIALQESVSSEVYCGLTLVVRVFPKDSADPVFAIDRSQAGLGERVDAVAKRAIDIFGSLLAIVLLSPVFVVLAVLVKCTSKGPVLYRRNRLGQYGREFCFYKFRTMYADNDPEIHREYVSKLIAGTADSKQNNGLYKLADDPRVTPLGRFLRRNSLDELPQFFNVLLNDMSLVGPRPPLPYEYERYNTWHRRRVLDVKPGLTGIWQVEGRSRTTFEEMVRMDLRYARTRTIWRDLNLILRTPAAMFSGRGAC
jgi:lipopolysaccharide/colanic/teichoic acid biosynthesis glycosyltransferase